MRVSSIRNNDASIEIYFEGLGYWEEYDLILDILKDEFGISLKESTDAVYSRDSLLSRDGLLFHFRHDSMLGNYIYAGKEGQTEHLIRLAENVIDNIKGKINTTTG